jgi:NAD(P)-dependent dehydrogenase (short-subunit alcohol dehydrogenase family)
MKMSRLAGKTIAIIGGATGIGAATAKKAAAEGASVFLGDINLDAAERLATDIRAAHGIIEVHPADQGEDASVRNFMQAAFDRYRRIDGAFLNGADIGPASIAADTDAVTIDLDVWDRIMRINLRGYLLGIRYAVPIMLRNGGGSIVCTSSEFSFTSDGSLPTYGISKAGINQLVRHTAARFGRERIRCNAIAPGIIMTETAKRSLTPELERKFLSTVCGPRLGIPEDIANLFVHLVSDESEFINGQVISVNGGTYFR